MEEERSPIEGPWHVALCANQFCHYLLFRVSDDYIFPDVGCTEHQCRRCKEVSIIGFDKLTPPRPHAIFVRARGAYRMYRDQARELRERRKEKA